MRPPVIVEVNGNCDCADYLLDILEDLVFKQFILHRVVDAFCLGVVFLIVN